MSTTRYRVTSTSVDTTDLASRPREVLTPSGRRTQGVHLLFFCRSY